MSNAHPQLNSWLAEVPAKRVGPRTVAPQEALEALLKEEEENKARQEAAKKKAAEKKEKKKANKAEKKKAEGETL
jgi:hypothetical protein